MHTSIYSFCLLIVMMSRLDAVVLATFRGDNPNLFQIDGLPVTQGLDIDGDGLDDFIFSRDAGLVISLQAVGDNRFVGTLSSPPDNGGKVEPVVLGSLLGPDSSEFSGDWYNHTDNNGSSGFGLFTLQFQDAFIGVEFQRNGNTHYGWIQYEGFGVAEFQLLGGPDGPITFIGFDELGGFIDSWAYETEPNTAIIAGAIPEPSSFLLSIFGGVMIFRRQRS